MNASMARRIRNAETVLISAIDRRSQEGDWRVWGHQAQPQQDRPRLVAEPDQTGRLVFSGESASHLA